MRGLWKLREIFGVSVALTLALTLCSPAHAASFTLTPAGPDFTSGAGPFDWSFETSSNPTGYEGWVGYKLSTEPTWHRCVGASSFNVQLANLPDGTYSIAIADDVNEEYLAANGTFNSSLNTCGNPSLGPPGAISQDTITIDSTPPTVSAPQVIVAGSMAQISVEATDSGTGVSSYTWFLGDGASQTTTQPYDRYTYLWAGTFQGQVIVADAAGNQAARSFSVTILPPPSPNTPAQATPAPSTPATNATPSALRVAGAERYAAQIVARRLDAHPRVSASCTRVNAHTVHCALAWRANHTAYRAAGRIWDSSAPARLHYVLVGTRTALQCHSRRSRCVRRFRWRG